MEDLYVIGSTKHITRNSGVLQFWGKNECGYPTNLEKAGKYKKEDLPRNFPFWHKDMNIWEERNEHFYIKISQLENLGKKETIIRIT